LCCPTLEAKRRFAVPDDRLVAVSDGAQPQLVGPLWQWVHTRYNDDKRTAPAKPERYALRFLEGGKISVRADCNLKGGTYSAEGKHLSIKIINSTMAVCEPGSLEDEFVRNLTAGTLYFFRDGDLYIDLKYDSGTMKFLAQRQN
jgi:heat shock protein HslJ